MAVTNATTAQKAGVTRRINKMMKEKFPSIEYSAYGRQCFQEFVLYYNDGEQKPDVEEIAKEVNEVTNGFPIEIQVLRRYHKKGIKRAFYAWEEKIVLNPIV